MPEEDIRSVKRRYSAQMLGTPGISGFGVERDETGREELVLHVGNTDPGFLGRLPRELDGHPVRVIHSGPFRAFDE